MVTERNAQSTSYLDQTLVSILTKGHFTKVYSIKVCEPQNFPKFPWDPVIGLDSKQTVCLQLNPIGGSQGNLGKFREILKFTDFDRVNFREMAFSKALLSTKACAKKLNKC